MLSGIYPEMNTKMGIKAFERPEICNDQC